MLIPGQRVHFVGIGGIGLSAIAHVMLHQGYIVSGSDRSSNDQTQSLALQGAMVFQGHQASHVGDADVLIISSAIPADNPEVQYARQHGLPVLKRSDMLGDLMKGYTGIAVAGTHGKTTTTSMIVHILSEAGLDPSYIVGGVVTSTGSNAGVGRGDIFVIEADEYDHMFLGLRPSVGVIANVEHDHPDLFPTMNDLVNDFRQFAALVPEAGLLVVGADDPVAMTLGNNREVLQCPVQSFGIQNPSARWRASDLAPNVAGGMDFALRHDGQHLARVTLRVPGVHNVLNALAAVVVADYCEVPLEDTVAALATFSGAGRRFEIKGVAGGVTVIDDYAHHPTAIQRTLEAARMTYPRADIWAVWQPHTYSRLHALFDDFVAAFDADTASHVLITDVYAAREQASEGLGVADLIARIDHPDVRHTPALDDAVCALREGIKPGDVVITLSAGDAPQIGISLLSWLSGTDPDA